MIMRLFFCTKKEKWQCLGIVHKKVQRFVNFFVVKVGAILGVCREAKEGKIFSERS